MATVQYVLYDIIKQTVGNTDSFGLLNCAYLNYPNVGAGDILGFIGCTHYFINNGVKLFYSSFGNIKGTTQLGYGSIAYINYIWLLNK